MQILHGRAGSSIFINAGDCSSFRFAKSYAHVGTTTAVALDMSEEVTKRCGAMCQESACLAQRILKAQGIPLL